MRIGKRDKSALGVGARWITALSVSLGCHAALLGLLPMWGAASFSDAVIAVSVLGDGGAGDGAAGGSGADDQLASGPAAGPVAPPAAVAAPAAVAPAPPVRVAALEPPAARPRLHARPAAREKAPASTHVGDAVDEVAAAPPQDAAASDRGAGVADGAGRAPGDASSSSGGSASEGGGAGGGPGGAGHGRGSGGDLRASCASCPIPEYPARARRQGWQGTVDVDLRVGGDGTVEDASIGRSSGFAALDSAAVDVARRSRFRVAGGAPVSGQIRYRFVLEAPDRQL